MIFRLPDKPKKIIARPANYEKLKEAARARNAEASRSGRDIAPLPTVTDSERRQRAAASLRVFCENYFPGVFSLAWSPDHLAVLATMQKCVERGGQYALAMPRGSGKTSICVVACLWALATGRQEFVCLIGSEQTSAEEMLSAMKTELASNDFLHADWPEMTHPVRCLDGIALRSKGQLFKGKRTNINWSKDSIALAMIPGAKASGGVVKVAGLTGRIRGMVVTRPDGKRVRPSLVILDDPQTDESSRILTQCDTRERLITGAVLGLAGPGKKIAAIMPCTVIHQNDLADRLLDRTRNPQWQGKRTKMVYEWPKAEKLWEEYAKIRAEGMKANRGLADANVFYRANREVMDAGAVVAWPERFEPDELSAIQHAWNKRIDLRSAFWSEYQNEPQIEETGGDEIRDPAVIAARTNGHKRGELPAWAQHLTMFVDVHDRLLYWAIVVWGKDFSGAIVDYDAWPKQRQDYFAMRLATRTLGRAMPGAGVEGAILAGLKTLLSEQLMREFHRTDGAVFQVEKCLVDSGYLPKIVEQAVRQMARGAVLMPSKGVGIGAAERPMAEYKHAIGDQEGFFWRIPSMRNRRELRIANIDTNFWKSFVHARFSTAMGDATAVSLFGTDKQRHRLFAEHCTVEIPTLTEGRGRKVVNWKLPPARPDNHFFDCMVGCAVAASMLGVMLPGTEAEVPRNRRRILFSHDR